jgi:hypothetical protein
MCGAPSNAQAPAWQEMSVLLPYSLHFGRGTWPQTNYRALPPAPGAPSAHMAHSAALPGQPGSLQPALGPLRVQNQRVAAPAGRCSGRKRHSRRLVVAAEEAPQARPKAAPLLGPSPVTSLAHSAPQAAAHRLSLSLENLAATWRVRRHLCLQHLPCSPAAAVRCFVSF